MPRPYWKGFLRLSLVTCPVELYPATSLAEKTHFHQINRKTGHRLRQQMVDDRTGEVVEKDAKGRGYELSKDRYIEVDEDELKAVKVESTHTIDIQQFVPREEIDKRFLDKPYYVVPGEGGEEAFAVIRDALAKSNRVALGRIVMANHEHTIMLEPLDGGMLATTLRYDYEVRSEQPYFSKIPNTRVTPDMIELAQHIIKSKEGHFDPRQFKDEYETALRELVKRKASGKKIEPVAREESAGKVIDIMDALRRSVASEGKAGRPTAKRGAQKRAAKKRAA
jgi:DNA end-binding protein Ku